MRSQGGRQTDSATDPRPAGHSSDGPDRPPFLAAIRSGARVGDLLVIAVPLVLLVVAFQLPVATRRTLSFSYQDPRLVTAFTAHYVHFTQLHLLANLLVYVALVAVAYPLAVLNREQTRFSTAVAGILLVFPAPLSVLNLAVPRSAITYGFSGLNMALLGYTLVEFSSYVASYVTDHFRVKHAPGFFFIATSFVSARYASATDSVAVFAVSALIAAVYWISFVPSLRFVIEGTRRLIDSAGYFELLVVATLLVSGLLYLAFPHTPVTETGVTNVYAHFIGLSLGFITCYVWALLA